MGILSLYLDIDIPSIVTAAPPGCRPDVHMKTYRHHAFELKTIPKPRFQLIPTGKKSFSHKSLAMLVKVDTAE